MEAAGDIRMGSRKRLAESSPKVDTLDVDDAARTTPGTTPPSTPGMTPGVTPAGLRPPMDMSAEADVGMQPFQEMEGTVTIADVATQVADLPSCSSDRLLSDVAQLLLTSGQTAAVVLDQTGLPEGIITEDDILQSYLQGAPWDVTVEEWMRGGGGAAFDARSEEKMSSVHPEQPLQTTVSSFVSSSGGPGSGFSSSVLVQRSTGYGGGVLSSLNLAQAMADRGAQPGFGSEAATVADIMEPLVQAPALSPGFTMHQLLRELLSSPTRAALISDEGEVRGLATASDALWAFNQRLARNIDAWEKLSTRPGRLELASHSISADAPIQQAAAAMVSARGDDEGASRSSLRALLAIDPETSDVIGLAAPAQLLQAKPAERTVPEMEMEEVVEATPSRSRRHKKQKKGHNVEPPRPVTVADVVAQRETATCSLSETLADAADTLVESGRTAAVVVDEDGDVRGVLTENDLLAALCEGVDWHCKLDTWLRGGHARLPGFMVPALTLSPSTTLAEAATGMTTMVEESAGFQSGFACHHLLVPVRDATGSAGTSQQVRLLSALDVARGMIDTVAAQAAGAPESVEGDAVVEASDMTVEMVMKNRAVGVATCVLSDTLREAFEIMFRSRQNCVLVVEGHREEAEMVLGSEAEMQEADMAGEEEEWEREHGKIHGVITTTDALRAFSERIRGHDTIVGRWLHGLTDEEHKTPEQRSILADASLSDAALVMAEANVHHLLVLGSDNKEVIGVISALDIVCALAANYRFDIESPSDA
eukprot:gb/GFBE01057701.1/.p1 GENE.gb/GFBE01057701.1/~~gb/GFBE01057701.1/.p1  ORF type:complete len:766 (+),score=164.85 gb/GFBE01057701.1/:1-2298(+)